MTSNLRLAAAGLAALLGLGFGVAPSDAATVSPSSATEAGELVPSHAGHDHGDSKSGKEEKKAKDKGKKGKSKGKGKGKGKDKAEHDHAGHKH